MRRVAKLAAAVVLAGGVWLACDAQDFHILVAGQYIVKEDCVTPGEVIDELNGPPVDASCDATCIIPAFDEGGIYVTAACPPFSLDDDVSGTNPYCPRALAAIHRHNLCLEAGPPFPTDALLPLAEPDAGTKKHDDAGAEEDSGPPDDASKKPVDAASHKDAKH